VQVVTSEGAPCADVDIFIRGRTSITQSGSPLFCLVEVSRWITLYLFFHHRDIESIDVLKDAVYCDIWSKRF